MKTYNECDSQTNQIFARKAETLLFTIRLEYLKPYNN